MDKISGIIPSSRRVNSVDLQNAAPVRPGTPTFGRPVGISTLAPELYSSTTAQKAIEAFDAELAPRKEPLDPKADIVKTMTDNFFMKRTTQAPQEGVKDFDFSAPPKENLLLPPESEREFTPPGTLLNAVA